MLICNRNVLKSIRVKVGGRKNLISGENLCKPRINYITAFELLKRVHAQITDNYGTAGQIMAKHRRVTLMHSVYKQFIVAS